MNETVLESAHRSIRWGSESREASASLTPEECRALLAERDELLAAINEPEPAETVDGVPVVTAEPHEHCVDGRTLCAHTGCNTTVGFHLLVRDLATQDRAESDRDPFNTSDGGLL